MPARIDTGIDPSVIPVRFWLRPRTVCALCLISCLLAMEFATAGPAFAQGSCLQNFTVDPSKNVTYFGWLPDNVGSGFSSMSCTAAEAMREELFIMGSETITSTAVADCSSLMQKAEEQRNSYQAAQQRLVSELQSAAAIGALKVVWKVFLFSSGKFFTIVGCLTPEPTGLTKVACASGVAALLDGTYDILSGSLSKSDIEQKLAEINGKLTDAETAYASLASACSAAGVGPSQTRFKQTFEGLCSAVKQSCL
jgi:hypothetical protein